MYNFVANLNISHCFKKSKYFKVNLGSSISAVDKNNNRRFNINDRDTFVKFYYEKHKIIVQSVGNIGTVNFFTDHYIKDDIIVVYYNDNEFVFKHEWRLLESKGIDAYLGSLIKEIEVKYASEIKDSKPLSETVKKDEGNAEKVFLNPGAVSWKDIEAFKKQRKA